MVAVNVLLTLGVAAAWWAAVGLWRLRGPLDWLHVVAFVNLTLGTPVVLAALLQDGVSVRSMKLLLLLLASIAIGAGVAQATGRALRNRGEAGP